MRASRFSLMLVPALLVATALAGCAPVATSNSQSTSTYQPPAAPSTPAPPLQPVETQAKAALLLPLSGPQAALGQNLLNAAQMALYDVGTDAFDLVPIDTTGTPEGASAAARKALAEGVQIVIGPVFTPEVQAVKPLTVAASVPLLALSNNEDLADPGVYVLGLSPLDQVGRVLAYAKAQGLTRIAGLTPQTPYGDAVANALAEEADLQGLTLVQNTRYAASEAPAALAQGFMSALNKAGGAQAVLFGDSGASLLNLASALKANGYNETTTRALGTGQWEDGSAGRSPVLAGGWYAAPAGTQRRAFNNRYVQTFGGSAPAAITPLSYDATALAAVLARSKDRYSTTRLIDPTGFGGVDGIFRLNPSGNCERGLAVFETSPAGARVIDAAPLTFAAPARYPSN